MKVVAHPLIVAVALGLLGPTALESDDLVDQATVTPDLVPPSELAPSSEITSADAPNAEDFERVQLEWEEARTWI